MKVDCSALCMHLPEPVKSTVTRMVTKEPRKEERKLIQPGEQSGIIPSW